MQFSIVTTNNSAKGKTDLKFTNMCCVLLSWCLSPELIYAFVDGVDYQISVDSFTILPGEKSVTINVDVFNDTTVEETEFFDLIISNASVEGAMVDSTRLFTQVQIIDSDSRLSQYTAKACYM